MVCKTREVAGSAISWSRRTRNYAAEFFSHVKIIPVLMLLTNSSLSQASYTVPASDVEVTKVNSCFCEECEECDLADRNQ
jgi:hypothetical protein